MIKINGNKLLTEKYPNQETKVKDFVGGINVQKPIVEFKYENDGDLVQLMMLKKRLDETGRSAELFIWYMPYSRMDREIPGKDGEPGDLFTLKYITEFIGQLGFDKVTVMEPHSKKTVELFKQNGVNVQDIYPTKDWIKQFVKDGVIAEHDHVVFPDAGAQARYADLDLPNILTFDKKRNPQTGRIEGIYLKDGQRVYKGSNAIILDDLCSYGGTFMGSGGVLKQEGVKKVDLMVAHLEDSVLNGKMLNDDSPIDTVYASDSIFTGSHPKIQKLELDIERYV